MRVGSLFAGIGGLDLSVEAHFASLGCAVETVWQVENDAFCNQVLAQHWPRATRAVRDVRRAGRDTLAPVDALAAGFPCQPVSLAGRRKAREDARWLWPEVARIIGDMGPRYVFLENVPGLLSASGGRAFGDVLGSLASLGYAAEWDHFRASDVGAPHRRERWFLLAYCERIEGGERHGVDVLRRRARDAEQTRVGGGSGAVADTRSTGLERPDARAERAGVGAARRGRAGVADALRGAPIGRQPKRVRGRTVPPCAGSGGAAGVGIDLVNPDGERCEERDRRPVATGAELPGPRGGIVRDGGGAAEPGVGVDPARTPSALDRARAEWPGWPAGRGEPQHAYEPPRTAHAVAHRLARLKALGNAVVWQQAALAWRELWTRAGLSVPSMEAA